MIEIIIDFCLFFSVFVIGLWIGTRKYKKAFKVACELINGNWLYGYDADKIFDIVMKRDGCVSSVDYEEFILEHIDVLTGKGEHR